MALGVTGLLERSAELEALRSAVEAARKGTGGRLIVLGGEAGIGKTSLLREKTVDHHVSAILRKLEARTRSEAASKAATLGITAR